MNKALSIFLTSVLTIGMLPVNAIADSHTLTRGSIASNDEEIIMISTQTSEKEDTLDMKNNDKVVYSFSFDDEYTVDIAVDEETDVDVNALEEMYRLEDEEFAYEPVIGFDFDIPEDIDADITITGLDIAKQLDADNIILMNFTVDEKTDEISFREIEFETTDNEIQFISDQFSSYLFAEKTEKEDSEDTNNTDGEEAAEETDQEKISGDDETVDEDSTVNEDTDVEDDEESVKVEETTETEEDSEEELDLDENNNSDDGSDIISPRRSRIRVMSTTAVPAPDTYEDIFGNGSVYRGGDAQSRLSATNILDNDDDNFAYVLPYGNIYVDTDKLTFDSSNSSNFTIDINPFYQDKFAWVSNDISIVDSKGTHPSIAVKNYRGDQQDIWMNNIAYIGGIKPYLKDNGAYENRTGATDYNYLNTPLPDGVEGHYEEVKAENDGQEYLYRFIFDNAAILPNGSYGKVIVTATGVHMEGSVDVPKGAPIGIHAANAIGVNPTYYPIDGNGNPLTSSVDSRGVALVDATAPAATPLGIANGNKATVVKAYITSEHHAKVLGSDGNTWQVKPAFGLKLDFDITVVNENNEPVEGEISYSVNDLDVYARQSWWGRRVDTGDLENDFMFNEGLTIHSGTKSYAVIPDYNHANEANKDAGRIISPVDTTDIHGETFDHPLMVIQGTGNNADGVRFATVSSFNVRSSDGTFNPSFNRAAVGGNINPWYIDNEYSGEVTLALARNGSGLVYQYLEDKYNLRGCEYYIQRDARTHFGNNTLTAGVYTEDGVKVDIPSLKIPIQALVDYANEKGYDMFAGGYNAERGDNNTLDTGFVVLIDAAGTSMTWTGSNPTDGLMQTKLFDKSVYTYVRETHGDGGKLCIDEYTTIDGVTHPSINTHIATFGLHASPKLTATPDEGYRVTTIRIGDDEDTESTQPHKTYTVVYNDDGKAVAINDGTNDILLVDNQVTIDNIDFKANDDGSLGITVPDITVAQHIHTEYEPDPRPILTIEKNVAGNAGENNRDFEFDVKVWQDSEYLDLSSYGGVDNGDHTYTFTLKDGESLSLKVPTGYKYAVDEKDYSRDNYTTKVNGLSGRSVSDVMTDNKNIVYTNEKNEKNITIKKIWDDEGFEEFREIPVIHLSPLEDYTQVEWIQSGTNTNNVAYIDTKQPLTNNSHIIADFELINLETNGYRFTGDNSASTNGNGFFRFGTYNSSSNFKDEVTGTNKNGRAWLVRYGNQTKYVSAANFGGNDTLKQRHKVELDKNVFKIDDTDYATFTSQTFTTKNNAYIFAINVNDTTVDRAPAKLYSYKLYEGDTLVRDYIPVTRNSDGKVGLLDLANKENGKYVFYEATSGNFTAGPVVRADNSNYKLVDNPKYISDNNWVKNGNEWTYTFTVPDVDVVYEAYEEPIEHYTCEENRVLVKPTELDANNNPIISDASNDTATFTNKLNRYDLTINKTVLGNMGNKSKEFEFVVKVWKDNKYLDLSSYGGTSNNDNTYTFKLAHGDSLVIDDIPESYQYEVSEKDYSNENYITQVNGTDGRTASGTITTSDVDIQFENEFQTGNLIISKDIVNGNNANDQTQFAFKIKFKDLDEETISAIKSETYDADDEPAGRNSSSTIEYNSETKECLVVIKGGQETIIYDIPANTEYNIVEAGVYNSDKTISDLADKGWELTSSENTNSTIKAKDTVSASFTNTYSAEGQGIIEVKKILDGRSDKALEEGEFQFELLDEDNNRIELVSNDENGRVVFTPISYTHTDHEKEFTYYIKEVAGNSNNMIWDSSYKKVVMEVLDNGDGTISAKASYYDEDDNKIDDPTFINIPFVDLPFTGGEGLSYLSIILMLLGSVFLIIRGRKKQRTSRTMKRKDKITCLYHFSIYAI